MAPGSGSHLRAPITPVELPWDPLTPTPSSVYQWMDDFQPTLPDELDSAQRSPVEVRGLAPHEAHALAQVSRRGIVRALGRAPDGHTVSELADLMRLHPNAVRRHLKILSGAGLVTASPAQRTGRRGRPSMRYLLAAPHALAAVGGRELTRLLLELVHHSGANNDTAEAFGAEQGAALVSKDEGVDGLVAAFSGLGFAPKDTTSTSERGSGKLELHLNACPFKEAVIARGGELICALHRGLVNGALGQIDPNARVTAFEAKDPINAGCRIAAAGLPAR